MNLTGSARSFFVYSLLIFAASVHQAHSSGFALIEHSASSMGNAFAGASAIGEDASTIYFNPASMSLIASDQIVTALHFIQPVAEFTNKGSTTAGGDNLLGRDGDGGADAVVPNFYYVKPLSADIRFGVGVNVPFGLAVKYDDDWVGRYHAVESDLETININPSVSYKLTDNMSIGYGINLQSARVILSSAIDFGSICVGAFSQTACASANVAPQQNDGFALLEGKDSLSFGWNVGLLYHVSTTTRYGVSYRSAISHHVTGSADFSVPGSVAFLTSSGSFRDTGLKAKIRTPDVLSLSLAHMISGSVTLLADFTWTGWSNFEELRVNYDNPAQDDSITTEQWLDSKRYAAGLNYVASSKLMLRTGVAFDQTPIPSAQRRTPRLPGNSRTWLSFGANYKHSDSVSFDVGYAHLFIDDVKINNNLESESPLGAAIAANLRGEYASSIDILSAQLVWNL